MKLRQRRRLMNYGRLYNHQLATVLEAAYEEFKAEFLKDGGNLDAATPAFQKLGQSYRAFRKFVFRFVVVR
ncbi:hypothetical protein [Undibacterium luofuense]|jgi:hypothetical protein|uniref:Uncharacterized protein n=1 Tax=Undibacterium luofuense TaxID=2828733 RepID=A0A941I593_9BURK|nr:hypothetical protein [Undibacterium luofuense]MBR7782547.1 hypothetical protein [Undibacterium luofuense]